MKVERKTPYPLEATFFFVVTALLIRLRKQTSHNTEIIIKFLAIDGLGQNYEEIVYKMGCARVSLSQRSK